MRSFRIASALTPFVLLALVSPIRATTRCVDPVTAGCSTTIGDAIAAAAAGDTIQIAAGTYFENVEIPPALTGLVLAGASRDAVIIDPDVPLAGDGILISADRVVVTELTIRNGSSSGIRVNDGVAGTRISKVAVRGTRSGGSGGAGILIAAGTLDTTVEDSEITGVETVCVRSSGDRTSLLGNTVSHCGEGCVAASGDFSIVQSNDVHSCDGEAAGIEVLANHTDVQRNEVYACSALGLDIQGDQNSVTGNSVSRTHGIGLNFICDTCAGGKIVDNEVSDNAGGDEAILVDANAPGLLVEGNRVARGVGEGLSIDAVGATLWGNAVDSIGSYPSARGVAVDGFANSVERNAASKVFGDGFYLSGDSHGVRKNISRRNSRDGFDVDAGAAAIVLLDNRASFNDAEGYDVSAGATATRLAGNDGRSNRRDFCDEGASTLDGGGNSFTFPGGACELD